VDYPPVQVLGHGVLNANDINHQSTTCRATTTTRVTRAVLRSDITSFHILYSLVVDPSPSAFHLFNALSVYAAASCKGTVTLLALLRRLLSLSSTGLIAPAVLQDAETCADKALPGMQSACVIGLYAVCDIPPNPICLPPTPSLHS
jgi:hypothetical protein